MGGPATFEPPVRCMRERVGYRLERKQPPPCDVRSQPIAAAPTTNAPFPTKCPVSGVCKPGREVAPIRPVVQRGPVLMHPRMHEFMEKHLRQERRSAVSARRERDVAVRIRPRCHDGAVAHLALRPHSNAKSIAPAVQSEVVVYCPWQRGSQP